MHKYEIQHEEKKISVATIKLNIHTSTDDCNTYRKARNDINSALSKAHQQYCCHLLLLKIIRDFGP